MSVAVLMLFVAVQQLPEPFETPWNRAIPRVVDRPEGVALSVPDGFAVNVFAEGLANPRRMELAPNGDVFVAESRTGEIVVLRDADGDGVAERRETFATGLERPFGLAFHDGFLYVGNNDGVVRFPYVAGQRRAQGEPEHVVEPPREQRCARHRHRGASRDRREPHAGLQSLDPKPDLRPGREDVRCSGLRHERHARHRSAEGRDQRVRRGRLRTSCVRRGPPQPLWRSPSTQDRRRCGPPSTSGTT